MLRHKKSSCWSMSKQKYKELIMCFFISLYFHYKRFIVSFQEKNLNFF
nr:MAG TPA: hypothetical protein [Caudoviricetes sp.]